eukprot:scaffold97848_cov69-Attheya_sp.AAC.4
MKVIGEFLPYLKNVGVAVVYIQCDNTGENFLLMKEDMALKYGATFAGMIAADLSDESQVLIWPETINMNNVHNSVKPPAIWKGGTCDDSRENWGKSDKKSTQIVFLGWPVESHARDTFQMFYNPERNKLIFTRDIA